MNMTTNIDIGVDIDVYYMHKIKCNAIYLDLEI